MQDIDQIKQQLDEDLAEMQADLDDALRESGGKETLWTEGWRQGMEIVQGRRASLDKVRDVTEDQDKVLRRAALEQAAIGEHAQMVAAEVTELCKDAVTPEDRWTLIKAELAKADPLADVKVSAETLAAVEAASRQ